MSVVELDGVWELRRTSGVLLPLVGMRKRIHGTRGATVLGPLRMPFDVRGNELRYRGLLRGLVDVVEGEGDLRLGRAIFRGRELGRFELRRKGEPV